MLISIEGDVGSGKTLFATLLALRDRRTVYANYKINIPNFKTLKPETLWNLNEPSLVILDEAYAWLESRTSGKDVNRYMSYVLFQSRKRGLDFILTEQLVGTIDLRYRGMINWVVEAEAIAGGFEYLIYRITRKGFAGPVKLILTNSRAEKLFPYYDTFEKIDPLDKDMLFRISQDKNEILKQVDAVRDILIHQYGSPKNISLGNVRDYCLRNDFPRPYVQSVYDSIKSYKG